MRFSPWSYRYADEILNSKLALKKEIEDALRSIQIPSSGLSRPEMNKEIERQLTARGWKGQKWEGSLTYEKVSRYLPHFKSAIQVPILVLGLDE